MAQSTSKDLLWVAPRWPFPTDDGAKIAQERLMRPLIAQGFRIHMLSIVNPWDRPTHMKTPFALASVTIDTRGGRSRILTRLSGAVGSVLKGGLPYSVRPFANTELRKRCEAWLAQYPEDTPIVIDGLHVAASLPWRTSSRWVYRAHNVEWRILYDVVRLYKGIKRSFLRKQATLLKRFESDVVEASRLTCPVSDADGVELKQLHPRATIETLGIGADFSRPPNFSLKPNKKIQMLFVGRLDWAPNKDGLLWFMTEIWPLLNKDRVELDIVGSGDGSYLQAWRETPGIRLHGMVETVLPYYEKAHVCLVPLRWASGTRVKIIEAVQLGRAVLSTSAGALGINLGENALTICETPEEWANSLNRRSADEWEAHARNAWQPAADLYGEVQIAQKLAELLTK